MSIPFISKGQADADIRALKKLKEALLHDTKEIYELSNGVKESANKLIQEHDKNEENYEFLLIKLSEALAKLDKSRQKLSRYTELTDISKIKTTDTYTMYKYSTELRETLNIINGYTKEFSKL